MTTAPRLTTDRLTLRMPHPGDADAFMAFYGSDRAQYVGGPLSPRQAWHFFGSEIGHWSMRGFGMFTVTFHNEDAPLGLVGHWYPHGWPEREVGWILFDAEHEGKGIAAEAAHACLDHAWTVLGWDTIVSYIDAGNSASARLAERLGATRDEAAAAPTPSTPDRATDVMVYRHPHPGASA
ncbi:GNAT family N-acetyltransferase [uncultured Roseobacter sp.]|uniref:GNAT family N-acetyltransferase n=1 Tax=uncultured Roseobacter sp. TaxID=114847 RepID=UPI002631FC8B|nr:GNAT family N-acetyltransferase [uncultured Roseobacter sp.]